MYSHEAVGTYPQVAFNGGIAVLQQPHVWLANRRSGASGVVRHVPVSKSQGCLILRTFREDARMHEEVELDERRESVENVAGGGERMRERETFG